MEKFTELRNYMADEYIADIKKIVDEKNKQKKQLIENNCNIIQSELKKALNFETKHFKNYKMIFEGKPFLLKDVEGEIVTLSVPTDFITRHCKNINIKKIEKELSELTGRPKYVRLHQSFYDNKPEGYAMYYFSF